MKLFTFAILSLAALVLFSCHRRPVRAQSQTDTIPARAALSPATGDKVHKGDVVLRTQAEISAFGSKRYTFIDGSLLIGPSPADDYSDEPVDLAPLTSVQTVNGEVLITRLNNLRSVDGLQNLATVNGGFTLSGCGLRQTRSLNKLTAIHGDLVFGNNTGQGGESGLMEIAGFDALTDVENIYILGNDNLKTLKGFGQLEKTGSIEVRNTVLEEVSNFVQLHTITGNLSIEHSRVLKKVVFPQLGSVGLFALYENGRLNGNVHLPQIKKIRRLYVSSNKSFEDYCGFAAALRERKIDSIDTDGNKLNPGREEVLKRCP